MWGDEDRGKWVKGSQKVQTSSCKTDKSWGCNVQVGGYS